MEFQFENLEVYQKALNIYRSVSNSGTVTGGESYNCLKRAILELCQSIVSGASCWSKENKIKYFLVALDKTRCLTPLVEGAVVDGCLTSKERGALKEEIENLCKMLSSLARWTREWADRNNNGANGSELKPSGGSLKPPAKKKENARGTQ